MKGDEFLQGAALHIRRKASAGSAGEKICRLLRGKAFDHGTNECNAERYSDQASPLSTLG